MTSPFIRPVWFTGGGPATGGNVGSGLFDGPDENDETPEGWMLVDLQGRYNALLVQYRDKAQRVRHLEGRIHRLKGELTKLHECRAFEHKTERLLAFALRRIRDDRFSSSAELRWLASYALRALKHRLGPRA